MALTLRLLCGLTHGRGGPGVPGQRADDGRADHPGQEEDRRRPASRTGCRRRPSCPNASTPCWPSCTCCSRPGTPRRPAPTWSGATWSSGRSTWPGCCGRCCPTTPTWPALLALILLTDARRETRVGRGRPAAAARRAGPLPVGPPARSPRASTLVARGAAAPAAQPATPCRRRSPPCTPRRRRWADTDWARGRRPLRRARRGVAVAGGGAQPGGGARVRRAGRRRGWPRSTRWPAEPQLAGYGYLPAARATSCAGSAGWTRRGRRTRRRSC